MVKIDLKEINDNISSDLTQLISRHPQGEVIDYKITDGIGIGLVLKLNDGSIVWFFNDETVSTNSKSKDLDNSTHLISKKINNKPRNNKNISYMLNPLNFITWLIYSLKDIF